MANRWPRILSCVAVLAICAGLVTFGTLPWREQQVTKRIAAGGAPRIEIPWAAVAARRAARRLLLHEADDRAPGAVRLLEYSTRVRPLHAPSWLDRALAESSRGESAAARRHLDVSEVLWPARRRHLWRLARARIHTADRDGALRALRNVLRVDPERTLEAFALARRVEVDPAEQIRQLLPRGRDEKGREGHLARLLRRKCEPEHRELVEAAWLSLSPQSRSDRQLTSFYVGCLVDLREWDRAGALWDPHAPASRATASITNGDFELPPVQSGLGWRIGTPPGASWRRDERVVYEGASSLRLDFDGSPDLDYHHASQLVLVSPGQRYRLTARWKGEGLESFSRPYLEVASREPGQSLRVTSPAPQEPRWDWQPLAIDFQTGDRTRLLLVRLRRDPGAQAGDRISGRLWLDALRLEPRDAEAMHE